MTTHDHFALESMMLRHGPFLRRLARALVHDEHRAEDLVQDTWVAASQTAPGSVAHPRAWLATVLKRGASSARRRESGAAPRVEAFTEESELPPYPMDEAAVAEQLERERILRDAVEGLEEPYRTTVFLRYHEGLMPKEIAESSGVPIKTVNTRLHRGLAKLREELDQRFGDGEDGRIAWFSALTPLAFGAGGHAMPGAAGTVKAAAVSSGTVGTLKVLTLGAAAALLLVAGYFGLKPAASPAEHAPGIQHIAVAGAPANSKGPGPGVAALVPVTGAAGLAEPVALNPPVAAASETATLRVSATLANGSPAAGCLLMANQWGGPAFPKQHRVEQTDADGVAIFELTPGLMVHVGDVFGTGRETVEAMPAAGEVEEISLGLLEGTAVSGRVLDSAGEPVAGATVYGSIFGGLTPMLIPVATSDAGGSYAFRAGGNFDFQAGAPGKLPSHQYTVSDLLVSDGAGRTVDLKLGGAGTVLTGRVVDTVGDPVAGATIQAGARGGNSLPDTRTGRVPNPVVATTGDDGSFVYPVALPAGTELICAFKEGFAITTVSHTFAGAATSVALVLTEGITLTGRVLKEDGTPLAKATVDYRAPGARPQDRGYGPVHRATTDSTGTYRLERMATGAISLRAETYYTDELGRIAVDLQVLQESVQTQDLQMSFEPMIQGVVADANGQPVPGVRVNAGFSLGGMRHPRRVFTGPDGRFRLTSLPDLAGADEPAKGFQVVAFTAGTNPSVELGRAFGVQPGVDDLVVAVETPAGGTAQLIGQVVNLQGSLPGDVYGFLLPSGEPGFSDSQAFVDIDDDSGRFELGPVPEGSYYLDVWSGDESIAMRTGIIIPAGGTVDLGEILIGGGLLELTVGFDMPAQVPESERKGLLDDQHFTVRRGGMQVDLKRTDTGWKIDEPLEPGEWTLSKVGGEVLVVPAVAVTITAGETTELDLMAEIGGAVQVTVLFPDDGSWSRAAIASRSAGGELLNQTRSRTAADVDENDSVRFLALSLPGETRFVLVLDGAETDVSRTVLVKSLFEGNDPIELDAR